ncbi:hypothetical protein [Devosia sp.]|uniref:hypothetical protein n=1 Tax=Devosia sp. TaxID=1871048 RepID=UPI0025C0A704|nr:hypothetical protein [Devosia sp.]
MDGGWWHGMAMKLGVSDGQLILVMFAGLAVLGILGTLGAIHGSLREAIFQL